MKYFFYKEWHEKRLAKIIEIFGEDWFKGKNIVELGACHGDLGIDLMNLGSTVLFTDAREEHLLKMKERLGYVPQYKIINQNDPYSLDAYDLVLHMGVLYHLSNWEEDLMCALQNNDTMILETMVNPRRTEIYHYFPSAQHEYMDFHSSRAFITQEHIEKFLNSIGYSFERIDSPDLNCGFSWSGSDSLIRHIYDWDYDKIESGVYDEPLGIMQDKPHEDYYVTHNDLTYTVHFRRMWLVNKML